MFCHIDHIVPKPPFFRANKNRLQLQSLGLNFNFQLWWLEKKQKTRLWRKLGFSNVFYRLHARLVAWSVGQPGLDQAGRVRFVYVYMSRIWEFAERDITELRTALRIWNIWKLKLQTSKLWKKSAEKLINDSHSFRLRNHRELLIRPVHQNGF